MTHGYFEKLEFQDEKSEVQETVIGPQAVLVCGFSPQIQESLTEVLHQINAASHHIIFCSSAMIRQPLKKVLESSHTAKPVQPNELPQVMILSGMTGTQLTGFLNRYASTGLPRPIFASTTPTNLDFSVGQLLVDLLKEQRAMKKRAN